MRARQHLVPRPDVSTVTGILLACGGILGGLLLEGGRLRDVAQVTAAFIVLGGTLGATLVSTPFSLVRAAGLRLRHAMFNANPPKEMLIDEIIEYATKARKQGLVSLEKDAAKIADPFMRKALNLAVDGADLQELRSMMDLQIQIEEKRAMAEARVFESAGGYSPTIGIIGAVIGLIQVMKNLANIEEVGHGIAVAFVATVYGVGLANIFLLPFAGKIKSKIRQDSEQKVLVLEGVAAIVEGLNPKMIRSKLDAFLPAFEHAAVPEPDAEPEPLPAAKPAAAR
ncbi:MAG TPA: flagellar motor protein [Bryobacteraceae bacterium]|nr:flagellar motor protein [Bryobacteraceae bacterium]